MEEIEIPTVTGSQDSSQGKESSESTPTLRSVPVATLFLRLSSSGERACLLFGFLCGAFSHRCPLVAILSGVLSPLSCLYYGYFLEELNKEELDYENVKWILFYYSLILFLSAVFAFFERYFLGTFAGLSLSLS